MQGRRAFGIPSVASCSRRPNSTPSFVGVVGMFLFGLCGGVAFADPNDLRSRLADLAVEGNFAIAGLEWIGPEAAGNGQGSVLERLNLLLQDYNHVLIRDGFGEVTKVLITSRKNSEAVGSATTVAVYTVRAGNRHYVDATIAGPNGRVRTVRLLIDTGATSLVLPASMISELGFAPEDLHLAIGWGVGGAVPTLVGTLRVVGVGAASADNIPVNFVPDERLRGTKLLGMSFLRHFRMTIDDQRSELVLLAR